VIAMEGSKMSTLRNIRMLMRYTSWANEQLFAAVAALPHGQATKMRETVFGNMVHTLNHVYVIDQIWKAHLCGVKHDFTARNTESPPSLANLHEGQTQIDQWFISYADALTNEAYDDFVDFEFVDGGRGRMTRGDILLHIANHTSYHRGFVADMFCQVPQRPPAMDLPVFLRDVPLNIENV